MWPRSSYCPRASVWGALGEDRSCAIDSIAAPHRGTIREVFLSYLYPSERGASERTVLQTRRVSSVGGHRGRCGVCSAGTGRGWRASCSRGTGAALPVTVPALCGGPWRVLLVGHPQACLQGALWGCPERHSAKKTHRPCDPLGEVDPLHWGHPQWPREMALLFRRNVAGDPSPHCPAGPLLGTQGAPQERKPRHWVPRSAEKARGRTPVVLR